jgi:DNA-binding NtrC family response regulator
MMEEKREVLILDEESESLLDLFELVSSEGFDTTGVSTEREALSWMARNQPGVLLDHHRPSSRESTGFLERVRALSPRTRIIRLAGSGEPETTPNPGVDPEEVGLIHLPYKDSELLMALDRAVEGVRAPESEAPRVPPGRPG